jgi:hypothetical protein
MSFTAVMAEAAGHTPDPILPFIIAGAAAAILLFLGIVTWSYRDVANRTADKGASSHDSHAGH